MADPRIPAPHPPGSKPPPAPVDYGKRPAGEAFQRGLSQLPQSAADLFVSPLTQGLPAAYHAVKQRVGAEPVQRGFNRMAIQGITDPYLLSDMSDTGKQLRGWLGKSFGSPQAAWETAKRTWANDPAQVVAAGLNAAHALSGGAGALSRAPAIAGTRAAPVLRGVEGVAGAVANPTRTVTRIARGAPVTEPLVRHDGTLHPKVNAALEEAAPGSSREAGLDPTTGQPVNPQFRQQVISTMSRKGPTPDAAREAILRHHLPDDVDVPRPATTGVKAPAQAQPRAQGLTENALQASGKQIASGPGLDAPAQFGVDPATGRMTGSTRDARLFTDTPEGVSAFRDPKNPTNPDIDASNARLATHAQGILGAPLAENTKVGWGPAVRSTLTGLGGAALGTIGSMAGFNHGSLDLIHSLGAGAIDLGVGALSGGAAGLGEHYGVEPIFRAGERQAQGWGAPTPGGPAAPVVRAATAAAPALDAALRASPLMPKSAPIQPPAEKQPDGSDIPDEWQAPPPSDLAPPTTPVESGAPPPVEAAPEPAPAPEAEAHGKPSRINIRPDSSIPDEWQPAKQEEPAPQADGGRVAYAAGGQVNDLVGRLMSRAEGAQKAARSATRPLLGLSDDTVAAALRVAQRGI